VPVGVCGEIAGDPAIALLLLGMGFDSLSMSPSALPRVKWGVRAVAASRMRALAAEALRCERVDAVHRLLAVVRNEIGLERLTSGEGPGVGQSPPTEGIV
jgi:phosphotransferase system enzyme I (PtsP)